MRSLTAILVAATSSAALAVGWHLGAEPAGLTGPAEGIVTSAATHPSGAATPTNSGRAAASKKARRQVDGAVVRTRFGPVQVRVVLTGERISDVRALHLTDADHTSRRISAEAAPVLRLEALRAQSAAVDTVSGATYTSEGYRKSLQAALDEAHR